MDGDRRRRHSGAVRRELRALLRSGAMRGVSNGIWGLSIAQKDQMEKVIRDKNCNPKEGNECDLMGCPSQKEVEAW